MTDYRCDICGNIDPTHWQRCEHPSCYDGRDATAFARGGIDHSWAMARGRPIDDGEFGCHCAVQKIDPINQRVTRVDMNLAKQLQRSIERNSKLVEQNRKLKVLAETLTASSWNRVGDFGPVSRFCLLGPILLFDRHHPSAPTCTRDTPTRAAAVKDGPPSGHQRREASLTAASTTA